MNENSYKKLDFLTSEGLALLVLINQSSLVAEPSSGLITQILRLYSEESHRNLSEFLADLERQIPDKELVDAIQTQFDDFQGIHDVYHYLSKSLKELRADRKDKLVQGSIVDMFIRRALLTLKKWSFNDLVRFHSELQRYRRPGEAAGTGKALNPFSFEQKLQETRGGIERGDESSKGEFERKIEEMKRASYNTKLDYLEFRNTSRNGRSLESLSSLHKYFDKSLNFLLQVPDPQEKPNSPPQNKINHAILNLANINFHMGFFDEVLRGVSEALRISQNSADDESINHCLCYLYQIAGLLGNYEDQLGLLEYAISHSLNLNNPVLMLNSCLYFCTLERFSDVRGKETGYLKARNISWTNALHYAAKKLITTFEAATNLKEVGDLGSLVAARTMERIAVGMGMAKLGKPDLVMMNLATVVNTISEKKSELAEKIGVQLYETAMYMARFDWVQGVKMILGAGKNGSSMENDPYFRFYWYMIQHAVFMNRGMMGYCCDLEELILREFRHIPEAALYSQFWLRKIQRLIEDDKIEEAFFSGIKLKEFNEKKGVKKLIIQGLMSTLEIYLRESKDFKGLLLVEEVLLKIAEFETFECEALTYCYKAAFLRNLGLYYEGFRTLKELAEDPRSLLFSSDLRTQAFYFEINGLLQISQSRESSKSLLKLNGLESLNEALARYILIGNLKKCKEIYYVQARILDEMERNEEREEAAEFFMRSGELQARLEGMRHVGIDVLGGLELMGLQEEIQAVIERNLRIVGLRAEVLR